MSVMCHQVDTSNGMKFGYLTYSTCACHKPPPELFTLYGDEVQCAKKSGTRGWKTVHNETKAQKLKALANQVICQQNRDVELAYAAQKKKEDDIIAKNEKKAQKDMAMQEKKERAKKAKELKAVQSELAKKAKAASLHAAQERAKIARLDMLITTVQSMATAPASLYYASVV